MNGRRAEGLNGPAGLLVALIDQAVRDATGRDVAQATTAWAYFGGSAYLAHLDLLGLAPDSWPIQLDTMPDGELIMVIDRMRSVFNG